MIIILYLIIICSGIKVALFELEGEIFIVGRRKALGKKILAGMLFVSLSVLSAFGATNSIIHKTKHATKRAVVEVGDKAEDVGDQTKKGAKKGYKVTKKAAVEVGDKAEDVGDQTKKLGKKV